MYGHTPTDHDVLENVRPGGQNKPAASTLSGIMQVQHTSREIHKKAETINYVFGKTLGVYGCTPTHEELQTRQEHSSSWASQALRSGNALEFLCSVEPRTQLLIITQHVMQACMTIDLIIRVGS